MGEGVNEPRAHTTETFFAPGFNSSDAGWARLTGQGGKDFVPGLSWTCKETIAQQEGEGWSQPGAAHL